MSGKGAKGLSGKGLSGKGAKGTMKGGDKKKPTSRSVKAGLQFPVGRIHRFLKVRPDPEAMRAREIRRGDGERDARRADGVHSRARYARRARRSRGVRRADVRSGWVCQPPTVHSSVLTRAPPLGHSSRTAEPRRLRRPRRRHRRRLLRRHPRCASPPRVATAPPRASPAPGFYNPLRRFPADRVVASANPRLAS
jgi:hypothetical protein